MLPKILIAAVCIGFVLLFGGCEHSMPTVSSADNSSINDGTDQTAIGERLENPYSVESMLRAKDSLEARGAISNQTFKSEDFQPTHYYIRFKPETMEEYIQLNQCGSFVLWDYPLDYAIPQGMSSYRDPEIPDGKPNYLYTVINVTTTLPTQNYEILAQLILAPEPEEAALAKKSEIFTYYGILEREALRITGNLPKVENGLGKTTGSWYPTGNIQVSDDVLKKNVPVVTVNVRVKNWFKWWDGYTDVNGNFKCPKDYIGDVSYSLRWQYPDNKFDIRTKSLGQAYFNGPNQSSGAWNLVISSGMTWVYAHIFRAGSYYIGQEPFGLSNTPFQRVSVCTYEGNAPADEAGHYNFPIENVIMYKNDNTGKAYDAKLLFSIATHEFGHAHHDEIYTGGSAYAYVAGRILDSWASAVSYFMTSKNYNIPIDWPDFWFTKQDYTLTSTSDYSPLLIDLIDNYDQSTSDASYLTDYISGYSLSQMETVLAKSGCKSVTDFENEIRALPLPRAITSIMLNDYFNQYHGMSMPTYGTSSIIAGQKIANALYSPSNRFCLVYQGDGNLVLYDTRQSPMRGVWDSRSWGRNATGCVFQSDGNLVIYNALQAVWSSNTFGNPNARLSIQDNGRVIIFSADGTRELWSTTNDTSRLF